MGKKKTKEMKVLEKMYNRRVKGYVISGYEIIE